MVQNITKSKSITQIVAPTEQMIRRDMVIEILMTGSTKIELHTTHKGINLMIDITMEIKVVMIGHQKQISMTGIDRHYDRYRDRDRYYGRDVYDRGRHFDDHSHDEAVGYHSEHQVNSKYKRELRHVPTEQCFQPLHSINHPGYLVYHTNYQYAEPILSVPSQNPDLIKDVVSNQQMINYHVLTSPVYLGPYH